MERIKMRAKTKSISIIFILLLVSSSYIQSANSTEVTVPPTPAYSGIIADNGSINAQNYNSKLTVNGAGGITTKISGNNLVINGSSTSSGFTNSSLPLPPASELTYSRAETVINNLQKGNGWLNQNTRGCLSVENTTNYILGNESIQLTTWGNGTACSFRSPTISPVINLKNQVVSFWIMLNTTSNISDLRLTVTGNNFVSFTDYRLWGSSFSGINYFTPNTWYKVTFSPTQTTTSGSVDLTSINLMQFRLTDDNTNHAVRIWVSGLSYFPIYDYPIVSYTFDDQNSDTLTYAVPHLDQYHFPATEFFIQDQLSLAGKMSLSDLKTLYAKGWDISPHTRTHPFLTQLTASQLNTELHDPKFYAISNGFSNGVDIMAYPHGAFNATVIQNAQLYYKAARSISEGCPTVACPGYVETLPPADPYRLRILNVLSTTSLAAVNNRINLAIQNHDWLILLFHHVVSNSTTLTDSTYVSEGTFQNITNTIHNKGIRVMTLSQVLNDFSVKKRLDINCSSGQFVNQYNSSYNLATCATPATGSGSSGVTTLNGINGTMFIGTSGTGNLTYTNNTSTKTITVNLGSNPVLINGAYQDITKGLKIDKLNDTSGLVSGTDTTKKLTFLNSGMTSGVTTTIRNNATTSQGINLPATRQTETLAIKPQISTAAPANGNGTTSTSGRMQHIGATMKAQVTGRMFIIISGDVSNTVLGDGASMQIRYNSGTAPANGAALTGNTCGTNIRFISASGGETVPFSLVCEVNGLTLGTNYWIDIGLTVLTGGTATLGEVQAVTWES